MVKRDDLFTYTLIPVKSPVNLDIMFGNKWGGSLSFPCTPGVEYSYDELKAFARIKRPSLEGKSFDLVPTA